MTSKPTVFRDDHVFLGLHIIQYPYMLEGLTQRIEAKVPQALKSPIPESHASHYWSRKMEGLTDIPDFEEVQSEYELAKVSFLYQELCKLSDKEFLLLQQQLQAVIALSSTQKGEAMPEQIAIFLIPGDKKNVVVHEREHIGVLPQEVRKNASIDIVIQTDSEGLIIIDGVSVYGMDKVTNNENALSFSEPQSLSETDIESARRYAQRTQDKTFVETIEQRIKERSKH